MGQEPQVRSRGRFGRVTLEGFENGVEQFGLLLLQGGNSLQTGDAGVVAVGGWTVQAAVRPAVAAGRPA